MDEENTGVYMIRNKAPSIVELKLEFAEDISLDEIQLAVDRMINEQKPILKSWNVEMI